MEWDNLYDRDNYNREKLYITETTIYDRDNYIEQRQLYITETTIYDRHYI